MIQSKRNRFLNLILCKKKIENYERTFLYLYFHYSSSEIIYYPTSNKLYLNNIQIHI